jgi:hypothetical protein
LIVVKELTVHRLASSALPLVNVTVFENQNIYRYSQWLLLLVYGLAALFSLFGVSIGFWCMHVNGASFSNNLSTIIRVTRFSQFGSIVNDAETSGVDPSPMHLKKTKVQLLKLPSREDDIPSYAITPLN